MSRPLTGPSPLAGPSPRAGPSLMSGPSPRPVPGPSPRQTTGPSPRNPGPSPRATGPSPAMRGRGLPTPTRSVSSLPVSTSSPSAPGKRREREPSTSGQGRDGKDAKRTKLSPGAAWIAAQVEVMQKQYKDAIIAATLIIQFKSDCKAIGYRCKPPQHLETRRQVAWQNYDATRRHVEWFIAQNAEYASSPEKFMARQKPFLPLAPPPMPTPSPSMAMPLHMATPQHAASPIPLSSSSFLSQNQHPARQTSLSVPAAPAADASQVPIQVPSQLPGQVPGQVQIPDAETGFQESMMFPPDGGLGLASIGIDDLNAFINGTGDFAAPGISSTDQAGANADFTSLGLSDVAQSSGVTAMTPNTSKLLATLEGGGTPSAQQSQPTPDPSSNNAANSASGITGQANTESTAAPTDQALGGAGAGTSGDDGFDFNFGDVDMSGIDLDALEGLFGGETGGSSGGGGGSGSGTGNGDAATNNGADAGAGAGGAGGASASENTQTGNDDGEDMFNAFLAQPGSQPNTGGGAQKTSPSQSQNQNQGQDMQSATQAQSGPPQSAQSQSTQPQSAQPQSTQPQSTQPQSQPQPAAPTQDPKETTQQPPPPVPAPEPVPEPAPEASFDTGELGDINFDDFNFDDQMPTVDGDEFASLFAEFK